MDNAQLNALIRERCKQRNITLKAFLEQAGLNRSFFYDLGTKDCTPTFATMIKIADFLDCSIDYLAGRTQNPNINQ